jgi:hypothetical protein
MVNLKVILDVTKAEILARSNVSKRKEANDRKNPLDAEQETNA